MTDTNRDKRETNVTDPEAGSNQMKHAIDITEPGTTGEILVRHMKSPFADDATSAKWIDLAISTAMTAVKSAEETRIEKLIANMSDVEIERMVNTARWKHNMGRKPNRKERRGGR